MNSIIKAASSGDSPFDSIRRVDGEREFWLATELLEMLGYKSWKRIKDTVERASLACKNGGQNSDTHFANVVQMTQIGGSASVREVIVNFELSRFGCYLVAMNGDPRKPEIAAAQSYFAVKTREAEVRDKLEPAHAIDKLIEGLQDLKLLLGGKEQIDRINDRLDNHESEIGRLFRPDGDYYSIRGWANKEGVKLDLKAASEYGRIASQLSKKLGITTDKVKDARFGAVKVYHQSVLEQVFV